jgi:hypothetical protein
VLELPIVDHDDAFAYGVWSSLSERSFDRVVELWDDPRRAEEPAYFGWLSSTIPGYPDTLSLPLDVVVEALERRPAFHPHDGDHPLIRDHRYGITMERVHATVERLLHQQ